MSSWRLALSLEVLRSQINAAVPKRDKSSDGTIGDVSHSSRASDHNPDANGIVRAIDITHDPASGVDARALVEGFRLRRDRRVKYCISNGQIFGDEAYAARNGVKPWTWNKYSGSNRHTLHSHTSVNASKALYDDRSPWSLTLAKPTAPPGGSVEPMPLLRRGAKGVSVQLIQAKLGIEADGHFGPQTEKAVKAFQTKNKLGADGIVGPYTWQALLK